MNIPDEAVRAAQNFLIQRDWRVPYDTVLGAMQAAGTHALRASMAKAWEEGAEAAWEKSDNEINGETYFWTPAGAPPNPYEENA